jgi:superfamily II DNA or RNA helicase
MIHMEHIEYRTLRSKRLRAALFLAANGRCRRCGKELGADWQADHVIPWSVTHRTNIHEMAALCARCNREKGARMLRKHQREFATLCEKIVGGEKLDRLIVSVTPGGGKSLLPVIAASILIPSIADAICWVVPRQSLQIQAEYVFIEPDKRVLIPHNHNIRISTNEVDPSRGLSGYVTTYQALQSDIGLNAKEFERRRYILILDEPHHIEDAGLWHASVAPLVRRAVLTVFMSGTWERGDGKKIAYVPYAVAPGGYILDIPIASGETFNRYGFVGYGRKDALNERAIKPLRFFNLNGQVRWIDRGGQERSADSLHTAAEETPDALYTALHTGYAFELLDQCVRDWRAYCARKPMSKMLVIAPKISRARQFLKHLAGLGIHRANIATSDDPAAAGEAIRRYKLPNADPGALDVLVTVAMAYEGLDVPQITHIALLTQIRSRPWIEQALARGVRVDSSAGSYEEQFGYVYGPDDSLLRACIDAILLEQEPFVKDREVRATEEGNGAAEDGQRDRAMIMPMWGQATDARLRDMADGSLINAAETQRLRDVMGRHLPGAWLDPILLKRMIDDYAATPRADPLFEARPITASESERQLRSQIDGYIKRYEASHSMPFGTVNKEAFAHFQKRRADMTEPELRELWSWLQDYYAVSA